MSKKKKRPAAPPERCPKCGETDRLTVAVRNFPDAESKWGGRVVWDNDTATTCGSCGFIGKVADFEPKASYGPEDEADFQDEIETRGVEDQYLPIRCRQTWGDPIEDETEIKRITDALRGVGQASREARTTNRRLRPARRTRRRWKRRSPSSMMAWILKGIAVECGRGCNTENNCATATTARCSG